MPYGLSDEEVEWLRDGYRLFREGDPAFMDRFAPDATFTVPPTLPGGGTYESTWEMLEFWTGIAELFENPHPLPEEFLRADDRVIVIGTWTGRSRETGEDVSVRFVHSFHLSGDAASVVDQKFVLAEWFSDTAAIVRTIPGATGG